MAAIIMPYGFDQGLFYDEDWDSLSYEEKQKRISRISMMSQKLSPFPPNELEQMISLEQKMSTMPMGMPPSPPSASRQRSTSKGKGTTGRLRNHHPIIVPPLTPPSPCKGSTRAATEPVSPISPLSPPSDFWSPPGVSPPSTLTSPSQSSLEERNPQQRPRYSFEAESQQLSVLEGMIAGFPLPRREIPIRPLPKRCSSSTGVIPIKFAATSALPRRCRSVTPASEQRHPGKKGVYISKTTRSFQPKLSTWDEDGQGEKSRKGGKLGRTLRWMREQASHVVTSNGSHVVRKRKVDDMLMSGAGGQKIRAGVLGKSWRYA